MWVGFFYHQNERLNILNKTILIKKNDRIKELNLIFINKTKIDFWFNLNEKKEIHY
jgi:hypothetical protein